MAAVFPYLLVEHIEKNVGNKNLFSDLSFAVNKGDRIALVARNGIGKSTILDILMGRIEADQGSITWRKDLKVHYLPQQIDYPEIMQTLSGGQKKRAMLEQVLSGEPDMLILDEPTNHLDLNTVVWLEEQLRKTQVTLLMVTHDRYFLDSVCNTIIEIDQHTLYTYKGNYSYYLEKRAERIDAFNAQTDRARNLYRTELDWMRRMPQARAHKAQYRIDQFYEIEKTAKRTLAEKDVKLQVQSIYIGNKIFEAKEVSLAFDTRVILKDFNYVFSRYEKLGIIGNNGTGKSSFLKVLLGELQPDSGCFDIGTTVQFGYYRQTGLDFTPGQKVIDIVRQVAETIDMGDGNRLTASQFLQHFLFSPEQQYDYVDKLSGGEKQRLHLCVVLMKNPNFLILDEPTNDLDIPTLQVLEEYLRQFRGCLIVVSHDRYFMDKVVDHLFVFKGQGVIEDFPGNYTQYRAASDKLKVESLKLKEADKLKVESIKLKVERERRLTFKEKQELAALETEIPQLEQEKQDIEQHLSGGVLKGDEVAKLSARYQEVKELLDAKEMRWLELSEV